MKLKLTSAQEIRMSQFFANTIFGIEFEYLLPPLSQPDPRPFQRNLGCFDRVGTDASCGGESVTPPLTWEKWFQKRDVYDAAIKDMKINDLCGGHVHVDWRPRLQEKEQGYLTLYRLYVLAKKVDSIIHDFLKIDVRRKKRDYCKTISGYLPISEVTYPYPHKHYEIKSICSKNRWINLGITHSILTRSKNTVEFRVFDGTNSVKKAEKNVAFALAFYAVANLCTTKQFRNLSPLEILESIAEIAKTELDKMYMIYAPTLFTIPAPAVESFTPNTAIEIAVF